MGPGPTNWERLNIVDQSFTAADIAARNISSVHTHTHTLTHVLIQMQSRNELTAYTEPQNEEFTELTKTTSDTTVVVA